MQMLIPGGQNMTENISWDEATQNSGFVVLKADEQKTLKLSNWKFEKRAPDTKIAANEIEFVADVLEEDGETVEGKTFNTTSKRLKQKLRPIFEDKKSEEVVTISILRVGEQFNTQYSCKEIKG